MNALMSAYGVVDYGQYTHQHHALPFPWGFGSYVIGPRGVLYKRIDNKSLWAHVKPRYKLVLPKVAQ